MRFLTSLSSSSFLYSSIPWKSFSLRGMFTGWTDSSAVCPGDTSIWPPTIHRQTLTHINIKDHKCTFKLFHRFNKWFLNRVSKHSLWHVPSRSLIFFAKTLSCFFSLRTVLSCFSSCSIRSCHHRDRHHHQTITVTIWQMSLLGRRVKNIKIKGLF